MSQMSPNKPTLISNGPIMHLLEQFEREAELFARRLPNSDATSLAAAWVNDLRAAIQAAAGENLMVSVTELAARPDAKRSDRTMRRRCAQGKVTGAELRGGEWMVGPDGAAELVA